MKKRLFSILMAISITALSCGCGSAGGENESSVSAASSETVSSAVTESSSQQEIKPEDLSHKEVYTAFLKGETQAKAANNADEREYYLGELIDSYSMDLAEDYLPYLFKSAVYAEMDCGLDGDKELAVMLEFANPDSEYDTLTETLVFRCQEEQVQIVSAFQSYYRYYADINYAGLVQEGGSNGASSYSFDYNMITSDGKVEFVYGFTDYFIDSTGIIPSYTLPCDSVPEWYEDNYDNDAEGYYSCYNFEPYDGFASYTEFELSCTYTLMDGNNNDISAPDEYMDFYKSIGMNIAKASEVQEMISKKYAELGVTQEVASAESLEWKDFTPVLPSRQAAEERKKDPKTIEGQIQTIVNARDTWLFEVEGYDYYVEFMISDLDRNGRLEIVSSMTSYNGAGSPINRFYEITEDYSGIYKMDYDCETKWMDGEKTGWNPDLRGQWEINCIITNDGSVYRYIVPTAIGYGDERMENKIEMALDGTGRIWDDSVGMKFGFDRPSYSDVNGLDCSEEEYELMEFLYYDNERYERVRFHFQSLNSSISDDNLFWSLMNSYDGFLCETYTPDLSSVR